VEVIGTFSTSAWIAIAVLTTFVIVVLFPALTKKK